jgi:hypothetical protein
MKMQFVDREPLLFVTAFSFIKVRKAFRKFITVAELSAAHSWRNRVLQRSVVYQPARFISQTTLHSTAGETLVR